MKIYLSGQISGLSKSKYQYNFRTQSQLMSVTYPDAVIINPLKIAKRHNLKRYFWQMVFDIAYLLTCDTISMQPNWKESKGAKIELSIAILTNKKIIWL